VQPFSRPIIGWLLNIHFQRRWTTRSPATMLCSRKATRPERIAIAGDSAGGGLVLSLCLRLRSESLPQPACVVVISPWADLTLTGVAPLADDALLRATWLHQGAAAYLYGHSARDPLASPLLANFAGLPLTLIQAASEEILRDDSRCLAETLSAHGVPVIHREFPQMSHDFQLYAGLVPEATQAIDEIAQFIRGNLSTRRRAAA
jgi:acetyl esterase/lipase